MGPRVMASGHRPAHAGGHAHSHSHSDVRRPPHAHATRIAALHRLQATGHESPHCTSSRRRQPRSLRAIHFPSIPSHEHEHPADPSDTMAAHALAVLLASIAVFAVIFGVVMKLSWTHVKVFRDFSPAERGDWGSRVNSTIHSLIIVPGLLYVAMWEDWDAEYMPLRSMDRARVLFSISCGYFLFDLYVLLRWQVPLWRVFVVHHIVAATPYLIYNFYPGCNVDAYLLVLFLLVEIAVVPLNIATFIEQLGYGKSRLHTFFYYTTYVAWFFARVVLPLYNIYILWWAVIPRMFESPVCVIPAAICGHLISAFCVGVFIFVWTPDMLAKWRDPVSELDEYADYKLTLRQSITPRASPICTPKQRSYGTIDP